MKLAVCSDDKTTLSRQHFCDSRYFVVYEILNGKIFSQEVRENAAAARAEDEKIPAVLDTLGDCEIFMARSMNPLMLEKLRNSNAQLILSAIDDIPGAVTAYIDAKDDFFQTYDPKTGRFIACHWC